MTRRVPGRRTPVAGARGRTRIGSQAARGLSGWRAGRALTGWRAGRGLSGRALSGWRAGFVAVVGAVLLLGAAACGVPSSGPPVAVGTQPQGSGAGGGGQVQPPGPDAEGTDDPIGLTNAYLGTIAGATTLDAQLAAARAFMTPRLAEHFSPNGPVTVVRPIGHLTDTPKQDSSVVPQSDEVTGVFQIIGVFVPNAGELGPPQSAKKTITLKFETTPQGNRADNGDVPNQARTTRLRYTKVPPMMVMSEEALQTWFTPHPIYFWDASRQALIPDLRYLPNVLTPVLQATSIVNWVLGGPSDWVSPAVGASPLVTAHLVDPTVKVAGDTYVVNLDPNAHALAKPDLLAYELRWSLGRLTADPASSTVPSPVELQIDGQPFASSSNSAYRESIANLAPLRSAGEASTYAIEKGKVVAISVDTGARVTTQPKDQPSILDSTQNSNVLLAAVNGGATSAALVRTDAKGRQSLWIRRATPDKGDFVQITAAKGLPEGTMSRPQFVTQPADAVVVAVNRHLYQIDAHNRVKAIELPSGIASVSAFSIAADAHRIAYVSEGTLYLSVVTNSDPPTMIPGQPIVIAPTLDSATAVAWSSVDQLIVAGMHGKTAEITEMNVDGSVEPRPFVSSPYFTDPITMVTAYSYDPLQPVYLDDVMLETGNAAYAGRQNPHFALQVATDGHSVALSAPFFED